MKEHQVSKVLAGVCALVTVYIAYILVRDIGDVYSNFLTWSNGSIFQTSLFTAFSASVLISSSLISLLIYLRKRNWFLILLLVHVLFVMLIWPAYILSFCVLAWWFSKYVYKST